MNSVKKCNAIYILKYYNGVHNYLFCEHRKDRLRPNTVNRADSNRLFTLVMIKLEIRSRTNWR